MPVSIGVHIFDEPSVWGKTLSGWQRCLLTNLVGAVELSEEGLDKIFAEDQIDHGLAVADRPCTALTAQ